MNWFDYLSLLSWQNCKITKKDFINLQSQNIKDPENLISIVSTLETKEYLISNKYWWKKAEKDYKYCKKRDYQLLSPNHPAYPNQFLEFFENAPIFLVLGDLAFQNNFLPITFVGSRKADELVLNWMDFYLPSLIKEKQICIVSGGARGIDQKAHKIAIRSQNPTLCFLPSGLYHFYPD
ncbi:MAG: DNA-processing protein DprA, partial [Oligoflexia bacterium]|nr:DNA-processing protein DprA [Oligoflexia bacterium]